jgi:protein-tyrosine phosphatase
MVMVPADKEVWVVVRPNRRPSVSSILPHLAVGEYPAEDDIEWLRAAHHISAVINLQDHGDLASKGLTLAALQIRYRRLSIDFHHVPIPDGDSETLRLRLGGLVDLLRQLIGAGRDVYVHCNGGFNRAPTVVIAYLHVAHHMPLPDAVRFVKRRPCVPYVTALEAHYGRAKTRPG